MDNCYKVLVVGGAGSMGQWFTLFFSRRGMEVTIYDLSPLTEAILEELRLKATKKGIPYKGQYLKEIDDYEEYDVVLIAVPMGEVPKVIREIAPRLRSGSLLLDITSLKVESMKAMAEYAPRGVSILGTHPLFGNNVEDIQGHTIVITKLENRCEERWLRWLKTQFEEEGAILIESTPERHDEMMSFVQALTHFAHFAMGKTFKRLDLDLSESYVYKTPFYEVLFHFLGRLLGQDHRLYADIQMNSFKKDIQRIFIEECLHLLKFIEEKDRRGFIEEIREVARHFGEANIGFALLNSKRIVDDLVKRRIDLLSSPGKVRAIKNIRKGTIHVGLVKGIDLKSELLVLQEGNREVGLKFKTIEVLDDEELEEWKRKNLPPQKRDISTMVLKEAAPEIVAEVLGNIEGVLSVEIIDCYEGPQIEKGYRGLTFRLNLRGDVEAEKVCSLAKRKLEGLACKIRERKVDEGRCPC